MHISGRRLLVLLALFALTSCGSDKKEEKVPAIKNTSSGCGKEFLVRDKELSSVSYQTADSILERPFISLAAFPEKKGKLFFDETVEALERNAVINAIDFLDTNPLFRPEPALFRLMKIRGADALSVRTWLEERVQYVVGDQFSAEKIVEIDKNHQFENPGILPPSICDGSDSNRQTLVMANIGAIYYLQGKKKGVLSGIRAEGIGLIPFSSPRAGILIVGAGLLGVVPAGQPNATKVFQLATLLHEARHSDGNKESAGFLHAVCPEGHDYAYRRACDSSTNGAYTIDFLSIKSMMNSCGNCSAREMSVLRTLYFDGASRVLPGATEWDDTPEGHR